MILIRCRQCVMRVQNHYLIIVKGSETQKHYDYGQNIQNDSLSSKTISKVFVLIWMFEIADNIIFSNNIFANSLKF